MKFMGEIDLGNQRTDSNSVNIITSSDDEAITRDKTHDAQHTDNTKLKRKVNDTDYMQRIIEVLNKEPKQTLFPPAPPADEIKGVFMVAESKLRAMTVEDRQKKIKEIFSLFYKSLVNFLIVLLEFIFIVPRF